MAQIKRKPQITTKVVTKDGECDVNISLDININLNTDDLVVKVTADKNQEEDEHSSFVVPEFKTEKIKFGQKV